MNRSSIIIVLNRLINFPHMLRLKFSIIIAVCFLFSCKNEKQEPTQLSTNIKKNYDYLYQDPEVSLENRIENLLSLLTIDEKIGMLRNESVGVERLNIPFYNWWNEALHGVARAGSATVFPQSIGLAASFDDDLMHRIGNAISDEARAKYNEAIANDNYDHNMGLTFWSPNINVFRDPRWGRGQETYGEDPFLISRMGTAFVKGLQGEQEDMLKVAAAAKHFYVHSGPESVRHTFNASPSKQDVRQTYLPGFKSLVENNVEGIMCAYNMVDGESCCGSSKILQDVLRKELGFEGYILSDCGALVDLYDNHGKAIDAIEAAAIGLKAGVNLNCGDTYSNLKKALTKGYINENDIDTNLRQLLNTRFKLGMFDPHGNHPYDSIPVSVINSKKHQELAYEAAIKSFVLLKNDGVLPIKQDTIRSVVLTGPHMTSADVLFGNYSGISPHLSTILEGVSANLNSDTRAIYKKGILPSSENLNKPTWAIYEAQHSDLTIVALGLDMTMEGEEGDAISSPAKGDRIDLKLPPNQVEYLKNLRDGYEKPIVVVLTGGSPINIEEIYDFADAILFAWYPGEAGGMAVGDVLFGKRNPSGKLPITFPKNINQIPSYDNYSMKERTYKYMNEQPMFPFGYGQSYTNFRIKEVELQKNNKEDKKIVIQGVLQNKGEMSGDEVLQLYVKYPNNDIEAPKVQLIDFKRLTVTGHTEKAFRFALDYKDLEVFDKKGQSILLKGKYQIIMSNAAPIARSSSLKGYFQEVIELSIEGN